MAEILSKEDQDLLMKKIGFMMAQELAKVSPVDTSRLQKSFPGTVENNKEEISFTLPYYAEYVEFSPRLKGGKPNPNFGFIRDTINTQGAKVVQKAFDSLQ